VKFSDKVKYLRIKRGYTQVELAELTNITQPALQAYEAGKAKPLKNTAIQLAKVLGVDVNDLMNDEKELKE
jgi:transcriptional regulator with XRE-family HTH domain